MEGYFKVHRKIIDSQVFAHQTALKIWIWCLSKVSYKQRFVSLKVGKGETTVKIEPGQFIFGRFKAEEELNIDGSTIYKWIQKFSSPEFDMINIKSNNQYSLITICNWDEYQNEDEEKEQPSNNQVTAKEQLRNNCVTQTIKNKKEEEEYIGGEKNKKEKELKNEIYDYNKFYDLEIKKSNGDINYLTFVKVLFGENVYKRPMNNILKMQEQLSYKQMESVVNLKEANGISIKGILEDMEAWRDLHKNKTVLGTFRTFVNRKINK